MLKLKYLFPNFDLGEMAVKNWDYEDLDLFKYWRISSNAIYPFKNKDGVCFLRIAHCEEKSKASILAELEFLKYLQNNSYSAVQAVLSKKGKELEILKTPWGNYYSTVLKKVKGEALSDMEITDDVAVLWGKALGRLHSLSKTYVPQGEKRPSWRSQINWVKEVLADFPEEKQAIYEADLLESFFNKLSVTEDNFGLIHYDFELDNVFYDKESNEISPIDFDDSMYHWYAADIEQSIDSIRDELPPERAEVVVQKFLEGYAQEKQIDEDMFKLLPVFRRFANLYGYARVLRSVQEEWDNEPEWLMKLRGKLQNILNKRSSMFGEEVNKEGSEQCK